MTKKLINIKNLLRIVISVMVIISMAKSCSYALSMNALNNMLEDMKNNKPGNYYKGTIYNVIKQTSIQNRIAQYIGDFDNIVLYYNPSGPTIEVYMFNSPNNINVDNNYRLNTYMSGRSFYAGYRTNNVVVSENPNHNNQSIYARAYIDGNNNNQNYFAFTGITKGDISNVGSVRTQFLGWTNYVDNPFYFGHLFSQETSYNNTTLEACELNYNYRTTFIENVVTEDNEVTNITATLDDIELETTDLGSYWTLKCTNSTLLKYDKIYTLNVEITTTSNTYELSEQILFVPPGTLIESGVIIRYPSGDFSFNTENATNQIIQNQDENQLELLNKSGDSSLVILPTFEFSGDKSSNFFTFLLDSIEDVFLDENESSLVLPIMDQEITLNSSDFDLLPNTMKLFIGGYHWFWVGLMILKDIRKIFENLKNGDFEKVASEDLNANLI